MGFLRYICRDAVAIYDRGKVGTFSPGTTMRFRNLRVILCVRCACCFLSRGIWGSSTSLFSSGGLKKGWIGLFFARWARCDRISYDE